MHGMVVASALAWFSFTFYWSKVHFTLIICVKLNHNILVYANRHKITTKAQTLP